MSDTVESVKNKIFEDLPLSQKSLKFAGREMENEESLMDYGVEYEDILYFKNKSILSEDSVDILIKTLTGKNLSFKVNLSDDVESLKSMVQASEGIPIDQQRLIHSGREMEDGKTLVEYDIKSKSTIHLILKMYGGGCPMYTSDPKMFDPNHNLDFTNKKDDGRVFMRGGQVYKRPYGWNKVALNVKDNYDDTDWLGGTKGGQRMHEVMDEKGYLG